MPQASSYAQQLEEEKRRSEEQVNELKAMILRVAAETYWTLICSQVVRICMRLPLGKWKNSFMYSREPILSIHAGGTASKTGSTATEPAHLPRARRLATAAARGKFMASTLPMYPMF